MLDRNIWYHITACELFVLDRNTWYQITVLFILRIVTWSNLEVSFAMGYYYLSETI